MQKKAKKAQWFARGGNIAKMGPFETQELAFSSLITTSGLPIEGAFVWAETPAQTQKNAVLQRTAAQARQKCLEPRLFAREVIAPLVEKI